jgi:enoyl-CoA hydratase/carnithine racemase
VQAEIDELEAAAFQSADLQEGLAAFAEKRRPHFRGA